MGTKARRPKSRDSTLSMLNVTIEALNLAKEVSFITPAKAVFGSVSSLLAMIRVRPPFDSAPPSFGFTRVQDSIANQSDYIELGLHCADVCKVLERGVKGRKLDDLNMSVREAINQLTL